jgi:hypothetical protein
MAGQTTKRMNLDREGISTGVHLRHELTSSPRVECIGQCPLDPLVAVAFAAGCAILIVLPAPRPPAALSVDAGFGASGSTSGSFAVSYGILLLPLSGCASAACVCRPQSRRADEFACHRIGAAAAGVCRSTQTASVAHSTSAQSAQTSFRFPRGCAGAVRRAPGA